MKIERHKDGDGGAHVSKRGIVVRLLERPHPRFGHVSFGVWRRDDGLWWVFKHEWQEVPPPAKRLKDVVRPAITLACMGELTK